MPSHSSTDVETLVAQHLPLVAYAVTELASRMPIEMSRERLVSAAVVGLTRAADDAAGDGADFAATARRFIRSALLEELAGRAHTDAWLDAADPGVVRRLTHDVEQALLPTAGMVVFSGVADGAGPAATARAPHYGAVAAASEYRAHVAAAAQHATGADRGAGSATAALSG